MPARNILLVAAFLFAASPVRANPNEPLRSEMAELAKTVKGVLGEEKQSSVAVGEFTGPAQLDSQFGPGIRACLIDELNKLDVKVDKRVALELTGNYALADEKVFNDKQLMIKINVRIMTSNGDELVKLSQKLAPRKITDNPTVARVTGVTLALSPNGDKQTRNDEIRTAVDKPGAFVDGTKVWAKDGGSLGVEVLVRPRPGAEAKPREPKLEDGQAMVAIERDEIYELRLHNAGKSEGAVTITIDGIDVFHFSKDRESKNAPPRFTHFVLPPQEATTITGWHVTNDPTAKENVLSFLVTAYGQGAASQIGAPTCKRGIITVTYAVAATSKDGLPNDDGARSVAGTETGFGPGQKADMKEVPRVIGVVREVVSIRYSR